MGDVSAPHLALECLMLSRCLNPNCGAAFRYLSEGRVFALERLATGSDGRAERSVEHYWLCGRCSRSMKIVVENGKAAAVPKQNESMGRRTDKRRLRRLG